MITSGPSGQPDSNDRHISFPVSVLSKGRKPERIMSDGCWFSVAWLSLIQIGGRKDLRRKNIEMFRAWDFKKSLEISSLNSAYKFKKFNSIFIIFSSNSVTLFYSTGYFDDIWSYFMFILYCIWCINSCYWLFGLMHIAGIIHYCIFFKGFLAIVYIDFIICLHLFNLTSTIMWLLKTTAINEQ